MIFLRLTGWRILARRMKARPGSGLGEVDIVARRRRTIAFIEVKSRPDALTAAASITAAQRSRIARSAEVYLHRRPELADCRVRFDVMVLGASFIPRRIVDAWRP